MNLDRGGGVWRDGITPVLSNLMERISAHDNLQQAWNRVKSNPGVPGSDGMSLEGVSAYARTYQSEIR